jgi:hypothetical protein
MLAHIKLILHHYSSSVYLRLLPVIKVVRNSKKVDMFGEGKMFRSPSLCSNADFADFQEQKKESLICLFLEFCANSSIHGIKYFGCVRRTLVEK